MRRKDNARLVRTLNANEREVLMFLGRGATKFAMKPVKAKKDPRGMEVARCSLIGNGFNAGVVPLLLAPLFVSQGLLKNDQPRKIWSNEWDYTLVKSITMDSSVVSTDNRYHIDWTDGEEGIYVRQPQQRMISARRIQPPRWNCKH